MKIKCVSEKKIYIYIYIDKAVHKTLLDKIIELKKKGFHKKFNKVQKVDCKNG